MSIRTFFKSLFSTSTRRRPTRRPASRLRLETLEDRTMPSFVGPVTYPADSIPPEPPGRLQDFNGDGYLDYATVSNPTTILLGNGDGTFRTGQTLSISGYQVAGQAVGDFNGDGILDLAFTSHSQDGIESYLDVFQGKGDGTFLPRNIYDSGGDQYLRPISVDLDGNGTDDLVLFGGVYGSLDVWLGNADGTLRQSQHFHFAISPFPVYVRDLNGDGRPDLAVAYRNSLTVLLGNGDGTLRDTGSYATGGTYPGSPLVADFDQDGRPDLAVLNSGYRDSGTETTVGRSLVVLPGTGDGSFGPPREVLTGADAGLVGAWDFNADSFPDLAVTVTGSEVSVLLNARDWPLAPPPPPPTVSIGDVTVTEGNTGTRTATFTVTLSAASSQPVTIAYATADGSATAGSDYQAASGTRTFAPGETSKTITVQVNGDRLAEPTETFAVHLSAPTNSIIGDGQGIATILDDEPRISINDVSKKEGNSRTTVFTFTVTLSSAYDEPVTVHYTTADGTATAGSDYQSKTGTVTFGPGQTTKTITVVVIGDKQKEADETCFVNLLDASTNALFSDAQGMGTILNDDR